MALHSLSLDSLSATQRQADQVEPWLSELSDLSDSSVGLSDSVGHCRTVGLSDLSDTVGYCRILSDIGLDKMTDSMIPTCRTLSDTVGLSDCRILSDTVGYSYCRTLV